MNIKREYQPINNMQHVLKHLGKNAFKVFFSFCLLKTLNHVLNSAYKISTCVTKGHLFDRAVGIDLIRETPIRIL